MFSIGFNPCTAVLFVTSLLLPITCVHMNTFQVTSEGEVANLVRKEGRLASQPVLHEDEDQDEDQIKQGLDETSILDQLRGTGYGRHGKGYSPPPPPKASPSPPPKAPPSPAPAPYVGRPGKGGKGGGEAVDPFPSGYAHTVPGMSSSSVYSYSWLGGGWCEDYKYLKGLGDKPALLPSSDPLYSSDRIKECMHRCLNAGAGYSGNAFYVDDHQRCVCSRGHCAKRKDVTWGNAFRIIKEVADSNGHAEKSSVPCPKHCHYCEREGGAITKCRKCKDSKYLIDIDGSCVDSCPPGYQHYKPPPPPPPSRRRREPWNGNGYSLLVRSQDDAAELMASNTHFSDLVANVANQPEGSKDPQDGQNTVGRTCNRCLGVSRRRGSGRESCTRCPPGEISQMDSDDCQNVQDTCSVEQCGPCEECMQSVGPQWAECVKDNDPDASCVNPGTVWCGGVVETLTTCKTLSIGCYYKFICDNPCICPEWKSVFCGGKVGDGTCDASKKALMMTQMSAMVSRANKSTQVDAQGKSKSLDDVDDSLLGKCTG